VDIITPAMAGDDGTHHPVIFRALGRCIECEDAGRVLYLLPDQNPVLESPAQRDDRRRTKSDNEVCRELIAARIGEKQKEVSRLIEMLTEVGP